MLMPAKGIFPSEGRRITLQLVDAIRRDAIPVNGCRLRSASGGYKGLLLLMVRYPRSLEEVRQVRYDLLLG